MNVALDQLKAREAAIRTELDAFPGPNLEEVRVLTGELREIWAERRQLEALQKAPGRPTLAQIHQEAALKLLAEGDRHGSNTLAYLATLMSVHGY